jgi:predicted transcriptional regulator
MDSIARYFLEVAREYEDLAKQNTESSREELLALASKYRDISRIHQEAERIEQKNEVARKLILTKAQDLKKSLDEFLG